MSGNIPSQIAHMLSFLELLLVFILDMHVYIDYMYTYRTNTHIIYCIYIYIEYTQFELDKVHIHVIFT